VGIEYLCSPFCPDAVDVLDNLGVKGFKTGSGELSNLPLMKRIADTGKPVIVSTGMSTMSEIEETVNFFKKANSDLIITNCTSIYPAPYNSINLNLIPIYRKKFGVIVGHSDHTPDIWTSLGAISLGASIIEKHFTLNRCLKGPDHAVSLEPDEFGMMVSAIDKIYMALGDKKIIHKQEEEVKSWANHSVVSLVDISKGGVINKNNISVKRPGGGIPAKYMESLFQKKVSRDVKKNSILNWEDVDK
jgi:sialic acid synthase SpsE